MPRYVAGIDPAFPDAQSVLEGNFFACTAGWPTPNDFAVGTSQGMAEKIAARIAWCATLVEYAPIRKDGYEGSFFMSIPPPSFEYTLGVPAEQRDEPLALAALHTLREEIDSIDQRLLETIRQRLDCCARIGMHKRKHGVPMLQPHRIGLVQRRAEDFANAHGIGSEFLRKLYSLIIDETCRIELEVMKSPPDETRLGTFERNVS